VTLDHVRLRVLSNLRNVDESLAARIAEGLAMDLPAASAPAAQPFDMDDSPALRIIGKYPDSLKGRLVGLLITDGADGKVVTAVKTAVEAQGAQVHLIAPKIGGVTLKDGSKLKVDRQLAGSPSVLFDAVALVLSKAGCEMLLGEGAAIDFAKDAFGHLKAVGHTLEAQPLLDKAGVMPDARVVALGKDAKAFVKVAAGRQWDREAKVRILA
jgi:catalase